MLTRLGRVDRDRSTVVVMAERAMRSDPRMTDLEALMWNLDKDPHLTSVFANVS